MTIAFVLGNGVSRKPIDLGRLKQLGPIYGCNALYREFVPDVLVATDRPIAQQIQESGYSKINRFHTRKPLPNLGAKPIPRDYHGNSSGPIAVALAVLDGHNKVYMLGFDMGPVANNKFNNVYADTEFYKKSNDAPTYTGNWVRQLVKISQDFPKVEFIRVCGPTTATIPELVNRSNFSHLATADFQYRASSGQGL
jgi:hypothetical protein